MIAVGSHVSVIHISFQFVAAMVTPGGGRSDIPPRLKRHFCLFNTTLPSVAAIDHIFGTIVSRYFSTERGFQRDVVSLARHLVLMTRMIWEKTKAKLLPTPTRFHYVFNLRDLTRIWQSIVDVNSDIYTDKEQMMFLWQHEVRRVLSDRLVTPEDRQWFESTLNWTVEDELGKHMQEYVNQEVFLVNFMRDAPDVVNTAEQESTTEPGLLAAPKIYEPVVDIEVLRTRILNLQAQLNEFVFGCKTELVFFADAIRHLVRISRAIRNPGGHILLVGVVGSGKRSLAKLSARIAGFEISECLGSSESQAHNFLEDLKVIHKKAGDKDTKTVLIITEDKIWDETCYEYVNQLLTIGFVPNLFLRDEFEELLAHFEENVSKQHLKTDFGYEGMFEFYQERVCSNLHVVLCFSPVGDGFRKRAINYPGILAGCVIDWFGEWPEEALLSVARVCLADFPPVNEAYVNAVACIHKSVASACNDYYDQYRRPISVTPHTFLKYMEEIKQTYSAFASQLNAYIQRMETGVEKLNEAQHAIDDLRVVLALKEKELLEATENAEGVLRRVLEQAQVAEQVRNRVLQVKGKCESIIHTITVDRLAAREQLEAARPALIEAEEALNTLRPHEIAMLRKLQKPPHLIMRIMDCVLIMFNYRLESVKPDHERATFASSWNESLRMMMNQNFLSSLMHYPRHYMNEETIDLLEPYIQAPEYNVSIARKVCGNVAGLLQWTLSMVRYFWVNKKVIPLEDRLSALEQKLVKAKSALSSTEDLLKEKTEILAGVQLEYEAAMMKKLQLEDDAKLCYDRMCRAVQLIEGLSSELVRWTSKSLQLKTEIEELGGDSLQMAAFLTYCGAFNQHYRNRLLVEWHMEVIKYSLPHRPKLELTKLFTEQATSIYHFPNVSTFSGQLHEWALQGLPMDEHSIQNAIITTNAHRYPLLIDPQAQGRSWLNSLYSKSIMITSFTDRTFASQLEDALNFGMPFLIEHVTENLNPVIAELIEGNFTEAGGMKIVRPLVFWVILH
ncbi:hypothetical protein PHET_07645 [Paragonimus heterotremus]|uniref:Uncharacterized protein n=1 Tax=Paragonimus heterotremus TaxID=100268 RepID=A0A8J4T900_9TREM|nr:hypothetical protein PHET_07645 [Paragonimus heterotremus]